MDEKPIDWKKEIGFASTPAQPINLKPDRLPPGGKNKYKVILNFCTIPNCKMMRIAGLLYWCESDRQKAIAKGYETQADYCPQHRPQGHPDNALDPNTFPQKL